MNAPADQGAITKDRVDFIKWWWVAALGAILLLAVSVAGFLVTATSSEPGDERCQTQGPPQSGYDLDGWSRTPSSTECSWRSRTSTLEKSVPSPTQEVVGYAAAMLSLAALPWVAALAVILTLCRLVGHKIGSCRSRIRLPVVPASIRRRLRRITPTAAARAAPSKAIRKPPRNLQLHSTPRRRVRRRCHPWTPRPRQRRLRRGARCSESLGTERRSDSWPGELTRARRW